jgi:DNA-directed RNA polymerase specialized sigma24 family protein
LVFSGELVDVLADTEAPDRPDARLLALDHCLANLTDTQREIVRERYTPGRSLEQYASDSGRSPGGLRMALLRIRDILKDCVETTLAGERS